MIKDVWDNLGEKLGRMARFGLVAGGGLIIVLTILLGYWLLKPDYQPLFTELSPQDAAAMTAELDRQKIPYVLSDQSGDGTAILVDRRDVYKTRIKLMGKDIPLHGTVGFELFNTNDFGMTEFAQKINYQRALQGELTRTILSLSEIRDARVLLALPEQGLFKQDTAKPKASVTLSLKEGSRLRPEQISGIQRLVASAVPGIQAEDVTLVSQDGVALSRIGDGDSETGGGSARLDLKKDMEAYLERKAQVVLERALGAGQAMASVDVTLDMDRTQSNTDEVLSVPGDGAPTGVVIKERNSTREMDAPLNAHSDAGASGGGSNQSETEYAVGHHVEQVISQPGSIQRIQVAVVVQKPLTQSQADQLRAMVAASVGASPDRGDSIVVESLAALASGSSEVRNPASGASTAAAPPLAEPPAAPSPFATPSHPGDARQVLKNLPRPLMAFLILVLVGGMAWALLFRQTSDRPRVGSRPLGDSERQHALARIQAWMGESASDQPQGGSGGAARGLEP